MRFFFRRDVSTLIFPSEESTLTTFFRRSLRPLRNFSVHPFLPIVMKITEKSFPSLRRIPLLLSALFLSSFFLLACGGGGGFLVGRKLWLPYRTAAIPSTKPWRRAVSLEINGGAARTGQRRVNLSVGIADPGSEVVAYLVSASASLPDVSDASADASSDVVFDVWRNVDPTADTFVESYLDATLDSSADGTQTLHLWFRDSSGKLSDRGSDSIALYSPAGKARDAGQTACFNVNAQNHLPGRGQRLLRAGRPVRRVAFDLHGRCGTAGRHGEGQRDRAGLAPGIGFGGQRNEDFRPIGDDLRESRPRRFTTTGGCPP